MSEADEQATSLSCLWGYSFAEVAVAFSLLADAVTPKPSSGPPFTLENDDGMLLVLPHERSVYDANNTHAG